MEIWVPLISACIGGLIATIPILIGLAVQIYLHISENQQKKREAKVQLTLELRRNDIKLIGDEIDNTLKTLHILEDIAHKRYFKKWTFAEMQEEISKLSISKDGELAVLSETEIIGEKLARSLGDEIHNEFTKFQDLFGDYVAHIMDDLPSLEEKDRLYSSITASAGKLHNILMEKLISIRD